MIDWVQPSLRSWLPVSFEVRSIQTLPQFLLRLVGVGFPGYRFVQLHARSSRHWLELPLRKFSVIDRWHFRKCSSHSSMEIPQVPLVVRIVVRWAENRQKSYWYSPYTTLLGIDHKSNRLPIFGCIVNRQTRRRLPYPIVDRERTVIQFQTVKPSNPSKQRRIKPSSATNLSTQRRETSCRQENSTEITSRKRSDCKLQELCNNCERTLSEEQWRNSKGTVKEQ